MSWSVLMLLIACLANGITEGFHFSDDRLGDPAGPCALSDSGKSVPWLAKSDLTKLEKSPIVMSKVRQ